MNLHTPQDPDRSYSGISAPFTIGNTQISILTAKQTITLFIFAHISKNDCTNTKQFELIYRHEM